MIKLLASKYQKLIGSLLLFIFYCGMVLPSFASGIGNKKQYVGNNYESHSSKRNGQSKVENKHSNLIVNGLDPQKNIIAKIASKKINHIVCPDWFKRGHFRLRGSTIIICVFQSRPICFYLLALLLLKSVFKSVFYMV